MRTQLAIWARELTRPLRVIRGRLYVSFALGLAAALALTACVPAPVEKPARAPALPARTVPGAVRYRVVQDGTLVYARVFRGGSLKRLGHNHIIEFKNVRGEIFLADHVDRSLFDLAVAPADAVIDPPELRASQGGEFRSVVSDEARAGTRGNMLGPDVLDAAKYPYVSISSLAIKGPLRSAQVTAELTLRGVTRRVRIPVSIHVEPGRLVANGRFELLQSDFHIRPYSLLGGALRVRDGVEVVFTISAKRVG